MKNTEFWIAPLEIWKISSAVVSDRRAALLEPGRFEDIAKKLSVEGIQGSARVCAGCDDCVRNAKRPEFGFLVEEDTADAFSNSRFGYRAQFYSDPFLGDRANRLCIDLLTEFLIGISESSQLEMTKDEIRESLTCGSAKIWICERQWSFPDSSELRVKRWLTADPPRDETEKPALGTKLWTGRKLEVKGAFLTLDRCEVIPAKKRWRSSQIHQYGFS